MSAMNELAASVYSFGPGRIGSSVGALLALAGAGLAWRGRRPVLATALGLVGIVLGAVVAATAKGGVGTGNGLGGAYVAMIVGVVATALGGRALNRRRSAMARK
ncbi:DUF6223 family protein [Streptomyces sp. NPDC003943]